MPAIVTNNFRVQNATNFKDNVAKSSVYVSIGKSDVWSASTSDTTDGTPTSPVDRLDDLGEARANLIGLKKIVASDIAHVVPRKTWTSGRSYVPYDSDDGSLFDRDFYILTSEFKVYKCIIAGGGVSNIQPTQTLTDPQAESDGYTWKYMFTTGVADAEKFLTNSYMPVKTVPLKAEAEVAATISSSTTVVLKEIDPGVLVGTTVTGTGISGTVTVSAVSGSTVTLSSAQSISANTVLTFAFANNTAAAANLSETDYAQYLNQKASRDSSTAAGIERYEVTAGGTGYSSGSPPTVTISGDGTGATATAVVNSSGNVTAINVGNKGTNYTVAKVVISGGGGSDATARAVISPQEGHGVDPVAELGAFFISLNSKLSGNDGSDLTVGNDFRQVMVINEPRDYNATPQAGAIATASTLKGTKALKLATASEASSFQVDELIVGQSANAPQAYVVEIDSSNGLLRYHQNQKTGFEVFENGETIIGQTSTQSSALHSTAALENPEVDRQSGEILFLENRAAISRSTTQIEDIKVIVEF